MMELSAKDIKKYADKSVPALIKIATRYFNKYIRERDKSRGCISCCGGVENAGHYLSAGHHSAHRFNEYNCNGQCIRCNQYLSGNLINYRIGLLKRIGFQKLLLLEQTRHNKHKWDRFTLISIIIKYKQK